jgi:hypothetical protein
MLPFSSKKTGYMQGREKRLREKSKDNFKSLFTASAAIFLFLKNKSKPSFIPKKLKNLVKITLHQLPFSFSRKSKESPQA